MIASRPYSELFPWSISINYTRNIGGGYYYSHFGGKATPAPLRPGLTALELSMALQELGGAPSPSEPNVGLGEMTGSGVKSRALESERGLGPNPATYVTVSNKIHC